MTQSKMNPLPLVRHSTIKTRRRLFASLLVTGTMFLVCPVQAQDVTNQVSENKKPAEIVVPKSYDGDADFEEACRLRLNVDSVDTLKEIITLAKSAVVKGLDKADMEAAKKLIAASYMQKTQEVARTLTPGMSASRKNKLLNDLLGDLSEAIEFDPLLADAYLMKAELHARRKEPNAARDVASEGIDELTPYVDSKLAEPEMKVKLSRLLMIRAGLQSETVEAVSDLKRSIQYDPNNQAAILVLRESLVQNDMAENALDFFQKLLESNAENELVIQNTAELLASNKDRIKDALELLSDKIKILPNSTALLKTRARVHYLNEDSALAKADLNRVLELSKDDIEGLLYRARVAIQAEDLEAARKDVDTAFELAPNRIETILMRSTIAAEQKRFGDAIGDLLLIIKNQPKDQPNVGLLMQLGLFYSMDDRPSQAIKVFGQVIKIDSEHWQAYRMRGDTLLAMKDYSKAIADFEMALELAPKDDVERSGILNNLSWTLSTSLADDVRDGKRALELGLEACELTNYKKPHILSTLAAAYAETGQFDKAVEWSEKAVQLGRESKEPQLEQLEAELESYRKKEPWREKTDTKENKIPLAPRSSGVDT